MRAWGKRTFVREPFRNIHRLKFAVLLVDMETHYRRCFDHHSGSVKQGIENLQRLIRFANLNGIEVICSGNGGIILPELTSLGVRVDHDNYYLEEPVDTFVLGGFNRSVCVRGTLNLLLMEGFNVITTDEIMFGSNTGEPKEREKWRQVALRDYRNRVDRYYRTSDELMFDLELMMDANCSANGLAVPKDQIQLI